MSKARVWTDEDKAWLDSNLEYCPVLGDVKWKDVFNRANRRGEGVAGATNKNSITYQEVRTAMIDGKMKTFLNHRVVWYFHNRDSDMPPILDHIDGNKKNNRIENLRAVSHSQNRMNSDGRSNATSVMKGVHRVESQTNPWVASITIPSQNKQKYLGKYPTEEMAAQAYDDALKLYLTPLELEYARSNADAGKI